MKRKAEVWIVYTKFVKGESSMLLLAMKEGSNAKKNM